MDPRIRSLIFSHGGYAYEIAGCVVAFFNDPRPSKLLGGVLTDCANVAVERCGSQLSFPASARLSRVAPTALCLDADGVNRVRRESGKRPVFRMPPATRPLIPEPGRPLGGARALQRVMPLGKSL